EDRKKYGDVQAHESVESLGEGFFSQPCILADKGEESLRYIQRLRSRIKRDNEKAFFTAKTAVEVDDNIADILASLRKYGLCILTGELENFSKDEGFLSPTNKLSINKVYELHSRLSAGEKITDILNCSEIGEFLT